METTETKDKMVTDLFDVLNKTDQHSAASDFIVNLIDVVKLVTGREWSEKMIGVDRYKEVIRMKISGVQENADAWI